MPGRDKKILYKFVFQGKIGELHENFMWGFFFSIYQDDIYIYICVSALPFVGDDGKVAILKTLGSCMERVEKRSILWNGIWERRKRRGSSSPGIESNYGILGFLSMRCR